MSNALLQNRYGTIISFLLKAINNGLTPEGAQRILQNLVGNEEHATWADLNQLRDEDVSTAGSTAGINLPIGVARRVGSALRFIKPTTPECPSCHHLTISNEGGSWHVVSAGMSCPVCNEYLRPSDVVTEHVSWLTGTKIAIDVEYDRSRPGESIPLTAAAIRAFLDDNDITINKIINAAFVKELKGAHDAIVRYVNTLYCHPEYSNKFTGGPLQVLGALGAPLQFGLARNDLIRAGELAAQQWWVKLAKVSVAPATPGSIPLSRAGLRAYLSNRFPNSEDFDAFCLDHFEDVHRRFGSGMEITPKVNLLFQLKKPEEIVEALTR